MEHSAPCFEQSLKKQIQRLIIRRTFRDKGPCLKKWLLHCLLFTLSGKLNIHTSSSYLASSVSQSSVFS
jgi:hypothetical protein